jgi:hypothetical protein
MDAAGKFRTFYEDAFVEVKSGLSAGGDQGVVGDHHDGFVVLANEFFEEGHDFIGAFAVEVAGGLVAEEEGGVGDDGASDGDALFLTARELAGEVIHAVGKADDRKGGFYVGAALGLRELGEKKRELHVLEGGENRDEVIHLKDEADVAGAPFGKFAGRHAGDLIAGDFDAASRGNVETAEKIQQSGFARAAGTHERDEFTCGHIEIEALKNVDFFTAAAIGFVEIANLDEAGSPTTVNMNHWNALLFLNLDGLTVTKSVGAGGDDYGLRLNTG